jgi:putative peptidoglycan lipid II flippase
VLTPANVNTFNILGNDNEDASTAPQATDGSLSTAWATSYYLDDPKLGGEKAGTGLLIDMGKAVRLSQVEVLFSSDSGGITQGSTTAEIYLGNSAAMSRGALSNFTLVSPSASAAGKHDYPVSSKATGRYVLIWLTSLPKLLKTPAGAKPGHKYYQALIYNVVVRGSAASGSS